MNEVLTKYLNEKRVLILGFGREGKSTFKAIRESNEIISIGIADTRSKEQLIDEIGTEEANNILFHCGDDYQNAMEEYDIVFKSPGIVLSVFPNPEKTKIVSQISLFFEMYNEQIIGITGTKGKSTTTTLLYHILKESGMPVLLAGNIGIPVFDLIPDIHKDTVLVIELSCHQLEYNEISPHKGVLLNIHEEHLDHYGTMDKYIHAKENIYRYQKESDCLYVLDEIKPNIRNHKGKVITIANNTKEQTNVYLQNHIIYYGDTSFTIDQDEISLMGEHNYLDIAFVYAICKDLGITDTDFKASLTSYVPLPHRLQYLGKVDGVKYYDDSISTIDETTIQALNTIKDADTVLIGGMERGISYLELENYLLSSTVLNVILMEETGARIFEEMKQRNDELCKPKNLVCVEHLEEAVSYAKKVTRSGHSCVLSPAAASYGIFKNFEERGECFKNLVFQSPSNIKPKVAFICVHNSCRSQIAEALGKHLAADMFDFYSAGTETKPQINQDAVRLMKDLYNIDMEKTQYSKLLEDIPTVDIVITMGCNVQCPVLQCNYREDWGLDDPTGKSDEEFIKIIKAIYTKIDLLKKVGGIK